MLKSMKEYLEDRWNCTVIKFDVDCDMSQVGIECAVDKWIKLYRHCPEHYSYGVSLRNAFSVFSVIPLSDLKNIEIDKELDDYAWYVVMADKEFSKYLVVYSEGA